MTSKYDTLKAILGWCRSHPNRDTFFFFDVGIHTRSIAALCDAPFKGRVWIVRRGISEKRDTTHGLVLYALATNTKLLLTD